MNYWAVYCMEHDWPGLWRDWARYQVATVGWPPPDWHFDLSGNTNRGWTEVVNKLSEMKPGDQILARLPDHRIARRGEIVRLRVEDQDWRPIIARSHAAGIPYGEQGRHIIVRWNFSVGPDNPGLACTVPKQDRLRGGSIRKTISSLTRAKFDRLAKHLEDAATWGPASGNLFARERALSEYVAAYPERLVQRP